MTTYNIPSGGTIAVPSNLTIRAVATAPGFSPSAEADATYTIDASSAPAFPLTFAAVFNPGSYALTTTFLNNMARYDFLCFSQSTGFSGTNWNSVFAGIKSYRKANFGGLDVNCGFFGGLDAWYSAIGNSGASEPALINFGNGGAFLRSSWPNGPFVPANGADKPGQNVANWSDACPTFTVNSVGSATGPSPTHGPVNWSQFSAWYFCQLQIFGKGSAMGAEQYPANSNVGHFINDNHYMYPEDSGCWQSNSTYYTGQYGPNDPVVRASGERGWAQATAMYHSLQSNLLVGGNCDAPNYYGNGVANRPFVIDSTGAMDLVFNEKPNQYVFGHLSFANGLVAMMAIEKYNNYIPSQIIWSVENAGPGSANPYPVSSGDSQLGSWTSLIYWSGFRYQMAVSFLLQHRVGPASFDYYTWFDELDAGVGNLKWLGVPSTTRLVNSTTGVYTPPNTAATLAYNTYGIITIPFAGGTIYLYPAGSNDTVSGSAVMLPPGALQGGGGHHITYAVTPSAYRPSGVSSGAAFSTLTIQPRDAIFTKP